MPWPCASPPPHTAERDLNSMVAREKNNRFSPSTPSASPGNSTPGFDGHSNSHWGSKNVIRAHSYFFVVRKFCGFHIYSYFFVYECRGGSPKPQTAQKQCHPWAENRLSSPLPGSEMESKDWTGQSTSHSGTAICWWEFEWGVKGSLQMRTRK